jgi:hypothetical protein
MIVGNLPFRVPYGTRQVHTEEYSMFYSLSHYRIHSRSKHTAESKMLKVSPANLAVHESKQSTRGTGLPTVGKV